MSSPTAVTHRVGSRVLLALLLSLVLVGPLTVARPAPAQAAAPAALLNEVTCTSSRAPWLADYLDTYLENDIDEPALGHIGFEVYDRRTDTTCHMDRHRTFGSASTVKVIILAALLRRLEEGVALPDGWDEARWKADAVPMILESDSPAAVRLWPLVTEERPGGGSWIQHFLDLAGMAETTPGPGRSWGDTQITAHDMTQLMKVFTQPGTVLSDASREFICDLMGRTEAGLRWGVGHGAPPGTRVGVKIGYDDLGTIWNLTVHSVGFVQGLGRDYQMAILSEGTLDGGWGPDSIRESEDHIASVIHTGLNGLGWKARGSDRCLDVLDGLPGSGVRVQQWQCSMAFQQGWLLRRANAGNPFWKEWTFVNVNSGLCLGVIDGSTATGAEIQQQSCHGGTSQRWRLGDEDGGARRIWNVKSDKCLTADPATPGDGGRVIQLGCRGTDAFQQWAATWTAPTGGGGGGGGDPIDGDLLVSAGPDVEGPEGTPIGLDGSTGDDGVTSSWSFAPVDGTGSCSFADASAVDTTITCDDNGTYTATLTAQEAGAEPVSDSALVQVENVAPTLTLTGPGPWQLFRVNTPVPVEASFTDPGNDTHTCQVVWDDGSTDDYAAAAHSCDRPHTFTRAGMFTLTVTVTDDDGASDSAEVMVVVYDPDAGFANADGSVSTPAGALSTEPTATGETWFSLTARHYKPNDTVPVGTARAWLNGAPFRFDAPGDRSLEWLVVTPDGKVAAKGTGTLQGSSVRYGIVMYGTDAPDGYRVVVWPLSAGAYPTDVLTYDNVAGAGYDVDVSRPAPLRSGIVTIHPPT